MGDFPRMQSERKNYIAKKKQSGGRGGKGPLGRPGVDRARVLQSADQFRVMLPDFWPGLAPSLLAAQSPDDVTRAFEPFPLLGSSFVPQWSDLIWNIVHDRKFPRVRSKAQIGFLSDSLGAQGAVKPRRSREICAEEREKENNRKKYVIVRRDYYIECTCGYEGPASRGACPNCGTMQLAEDLAAQDGDSLT